MILISEVNKISKESLKDSQVLFKAKRYKGAIYMCGYVIELRLKYNICKMLKWSGFPSTSGEFEKYKSFKTHDLDVLLHLSGKEDKIKTKFLADWSIIANWDPEIRYNKVNSVNKNDAQNMIKSTKTLLKQL